MGRDGALFRGRYKAILVDTDSYLVQDRAIFTVIL